MLSVLQIKFHFPNKQESTDLTMHDKLDSPELQKQLKIQSTS